MKEQVPFITFAYRVDDEIVKSRFADGIVEEQERFIDVPIENLTRAARVALLQILGWANIPSGTVYVLGPHTTSGRNAICWHYVAKLPELEPSAALISTAIMDDLANYRGELQERYQKQVDKCSSVMERSAAILSGEVTITNDTDPWRWDIPEGCPNTADAKEMRDRAAKIVRQILHDRDEAARRNKEEHQRKEAEAKASMKAETDRVKEEKGRWIEANGSDYLKRAWKLGYPCKTKYLYERAVATFPQFTDLAVVTKITQEEKRCCPSPSALDILEQVLPQHPESKVVWAKWYPVDPDTGGTGGSIQEEVVSVPFVEKSTVYIRIPKPA